MRVQDKKGSGTHVEDCAALRMVQTQQNVQDMFRSGRQPLVNNVLLTPQALPLGTPAPTQVA